MCISPPYIVTPPHGCSLLCWQIAGESFFDTYKILHRRRGHDLATGLLDFKLPKTRIKFRNASPLKIYILSGTDAERTDLKRTDGLDAVGVYV